MTPAKLLKGVRKKEIISLPFSHLEEREEELIPRHLTRHQACQVSQGDMANIFWISQLCIVLYCIILYYILYYTIACSMGP